MDIASLLSNIVLAIVAALVFFICYTIYRKTKGATVGYEKWASATFIIFFGVLFYILADIASSSEKFSGLFCILGDTITSFGYFYLPVGAMYLAKDMGFGKVNEIIIKKSQVIMFSLIIVSSILVSMLYFVFDKENYTGTVFPCMFTTIWIITIYYFYTIYQNLKFTNSCWLLIFIAIVAGFLNDFVPLLNRLFSVDLFIISLIARLIMAITFVSGFLKLGKMVEAI